MQGRTVWLSLNTTRLTLQTMAEDETAKLWKVNRTVHELVKDRVRRLYSRILCRNLTDSFIELGISSVRRRNQHGPHYLQSTLRKQRRERRVRDCSRLLDHRGANRIDSRNQLNFFTNSRDNPADQIFIFFSDEKSVGVKTMRKYAP